MDNETMFNNRMDEIKTTGVYKIDLWVLLALIGMGFGRFQSSSDISPNNTLAALPIVCVVISVSLIIWWLKRCSVLEQYRYLVMKLECKREPPHALHSSMVLSAAGIVLLLVFGLVDVSVGVAVGFYVTMSVLLSIRV